VLAPLVGNALGVEPRFIGSPGELRDTRFEDDLRDARGCLLEAGGQIDDALAAGDTPVLLAADCAVSVTTVPSGSTRMATTTRRTPPVAATWAGCASRPPPGSGTPASGKACRPSASCWPASATSTPASASCSSGARQP